MDTITKNNTMLSNQERTALDRYLTSPPDFTSSQDWNDKVWGIIPNGVISPDDYDTHEDMFFKWEDKLFTANVEPENAAKIISRAFRLYLKNQSQ